MSKSIKLSIPEPCHEGWDKMTPVEKGRFCQACQKTVVDFSQMSDRQIIEYITKSTTQTCGHFYPDQLDRSLVEEVKPKIGWWKRGWNVVAASLLLSTSAYAQGTTKARKTMTRTIAEGWKAGDLIGIDGMINPKFDLSGTVLDAETSLPIKGVMISVVDSPRSSTSDSNGLFAFKSLPTQDVFELVISSDGYKSSKIPVSFLDMEYGRIFGKDRNKENESFKIYLEREYVNKDTIPICENDSTEYTTRGIVVIDYEKYQAYYVKQLNDSMMRRIADSLAIFSRIKVYPNPAQAGSYINVQLTPVKAGLYKVELFNPIGQLVKSEQINIAGDRQIVSIPLERSLGKGMYVVRIRHNDSKKQYSKKILVN